MQTGIMQGRLLPKFKSLYQSHPIGTWEQEFSIAKNLNIQNIEFILDAYLYAHNPLLTNDGIEKIKSLVKSSGTQVKSICADIFMEWPIQNIVAHEFNHYGNIIETLITNLNRLKGQDIVIPFVDKSSIKNEQDQLKVIGFLDEFEEICNKKQINLSLETDLRPKEFLKFISSFKNKYIKVNYDSGNSAALGYLFKEEIELYGEKISNIHIKDRLLHGGPVMLGKGNAELFEVKEFIEKSGYNGIVTYQAYRDEDPINTFTKQRSYFEGL